MTKGKKVKISLNKVRTTKGSKAPVAKSFRLHPLVTEAFDKKAMDEGLKQVTLLEKMVIYYINHGGSDAKIS